MRLCVIALMLLSSLTSCTDFWSYANQRRFREVCGEEAVKWAGSKEKSDEYCSCVLGKMMQKYPNEEDAFMHLGDLSHDTDLIDCKAEIMNQ